MATLSATIEGYVCAQTYDPATLARLEFWAERFGERELADITPDDVDGALLELQERGRLRPLRGKQTQPSGQPLAPATVDRYVSQLGALFRYARRLRLLPRAHVPPTRGIELHGSPVKPDAYFRAHEVDRLITVARLVDHRWGRMPALLVLAFHTGLRRSNLLELRWGDLDLDGRSLTVLKTKNGRPIVQPLTERAVAELKKLPGRKDPDRYVFEGKSGRPYAIRRLWEKVTAEAGLKGRNFHQLRHGCGSALAASGANQAQIMAHMGHRSLASSQRYIHASIEDKRAVADRVFG